MENLELWEKVRMPEPEYLKPIQAGRLKGKTDINPQWRVKKLTEHFGLCGIGWKFTIDKQWTEESQGAVMCFCNISLYIKQDGEWSEAIQGTGGSGIVNNEKAGLYANDEGFKMALTDAISVSCKMLGFASDIYEGKVNKDVPTGSKYDYKPVTSQQATQYAKTFDNKPPAKWINEADFEAMKGKWKAGDNPQHIIKTLRDANFGVSKAIAQKITDYINNL